MSKSSPPRKLVERNIPSGMSSAWKLWRNCMCRNGFYPLVLAPFVTAAFLLDIYSTTGCNFVHVNVGIDPMNIAWNQTELDMGFFHYRDTGGQDYGNVLMDTFHPECSSYDSIFNEYFIAGDKTWKVSRFVTINDITSAVHSLQSHLHLCVHRWHKFWHWSLVAQAV